MIRLWIHMPEDAIEYYETAARYEPNNYLPHFFIALSHKASGEYDSAMLRWKGALAICPKSVDTLLNIGNLYQKTDLNAAEDCYQQALEGSFKYALFTTRT